MSPANDAALLVEFPTACRESNSMNILIYQDGIHDAVTRFEELGLEITGQEEITARVA